MDGGFTLRGLVSDRQAFIAEECAGPGAFLLLVPQDIIFK